MKQLLKGIAFILVLSVLVSFLSQIEIPWGIIVGVLVFALILYVLAGSIIRNRLLIKRSPMVKGTCSEIYFEIVEEDNGSRKIYYAKIQFTYDKQDYLITEEMDNLYVPIVAGEQIDIVIDKQNIQASRPKDALSFGAGRSVIWLMVVFAALLVVLLLYRFNVVG